MSLLRYLIHLPTWQKLPMLPRMYSTEYEPRDIDRDTEALMKVTHTRCPQGVKLLERRYHLSAHELIDLLQPRHRKRDAFGRMVALVRRAYGVLPYDPMRKIARQHMRRGGR